MLASSQHDLMHVCCLGVCCLGVCSVLCRAIQSLRCASGNNTFLVITLGYMDHLQPSDSQDVSSLLITKGIFGG